jgi:class 3 adenylate cyclase
LSDLIGELRYAHRDAIRKDEQGIVWTDDARSTPPAAATPAEPAVRAPLTYTPAYLAERILTSRSALEGERKQVTVLFADLKGSMELLADRDPEEARQLLDPVLERMMEAVHRYEGTVNQVMGDGIMALFGAPIAHEDHAEFLYETSLFPERAYTFKHALTHEVAYGSLLHERRRVLHARIVEALEALAGDRVDDQVERLAQHALRGEVWEKALAYGRQAGDKAQMRSA